MILAGYFEGVLTHNCNEASSEAWGCYKPANKPRWNMPCIICFGEKGFKQCKHCEGHGVIGMSNCPNSANSGNMNSAFSIFTFFSNYKILPSDGALLDQTAFFIKMASYVSACGKAWRKLEDDKKKMLEAVRNGAKTRNRV